MQPRLASIEPHRSRRIRLVIAGLCSIALICGAWLASVFYFLSSAKLAGDIRLTANRIRIQELEARRAEKDFMLRSQRDPEFVQGNESEYLIKHQAEVNELRAEIEKLKNLSAAGERTEVDRILRQVEEYDVEFQLLVDALRKRGAAEVELRRSWDLAARAIDASIGTPLGAELERSFLMLRRDLTDYLVEEDPERSKPLLAGLEQLGSRLPEAQPGSTSPVADSLRRCKRSLREHAEIVLRIGPTEDEGLQEKLRTAIHAVEPAIEAVLARAVTDDEAASRKLVTALLFACAIMACLFTAATLFGQTSRMRLKQLLTLNERLEEDVRERKRMMHVLERQHRQLLQSERLAAIGQMVTGLTHESGNALQRSQACLDMLAHRVQEVPKATELVARIQEAQNHLQHLYEEVREYAAPVHLERKPIRVDEIVQRAWDSLALTRQTGGARLEQQTGQLDLACEVDAFAIEQVFRNIFENSLDACDGAAQVSVEWSSQDVDGRRHLRAAVRDNGPGLSQEQRDRIFDPFFTTKTKGTGLGMAIAKRLVEAHHGRIDVGMADGKGAEILVTLPKNGES